MKMNETEMNETEKNPEEMETVNGGDIQDAINNYRMREEMKRELKADQRMRLQEQLKSIRQGS